ncbi:RS-norcoclaurine 6-O-methyltransferase-like protein [Cinnamomum micranthum f. kanehirae]|uniref:RS-norcoclaurine 6-O-methyltransferase-like protein n=1 Tax=Cinnamomum micranthum f. kanehirae TaxID=337451 RepID=A0A3S3NG35_9MAGN|nr:RS-norcoclaurine 6-O-methyltransferase-like protein [Cinnamomum micranthum f. kanehirae]
MAHLQIGATHTGQKQLESPITIMHWISLLLSFACPPILTRARLKTSQRNSFHDIIHQKEMSSIKNDLQQAMEEEVNAQAQVLKHIYGFAESLTLECAFELGGPDILHKHG